MPGHLLTEIAAQALGATYLALEANEGFVAYYHSQTAEYNQFVLPHDLLILRPRITAISGRGVRGFCEIYVGENLVSTVSQINIGLAPRRLLEREYERQKAARQNH